MNSPENFEPVKRVAPRFVILVFFFFASFYSIFVQGFPPNGDPVNYFIVAKNLVDHSTPGMDRKHEFVPTVKGREGRYYTKFAIGQSLIEAPFYAAGKSFLPKGAAGHYEYSFNYFTATLSLPVVSALACVFFLLLAVELGFTKRTAIFTTAILGLCTLLFPYARQGLSEPLQACALAAAFLFAVRAKTRGGIINAILCGVAAGVLFLAKAPGIIVAPIIFIWLIRVSKDSKGFRNAMVFSAVMSGFIFAALYYNQVRFGGWLEFGYSGGRDKTMGFGQSPLVGLYGLFFSSGKSMFLYVPALLAAMGGIRMFHKKRPAESVLMWFVAAPWILLYSCWWAWHGDWSWGPRFMVPLMPLLLLPLLPVIEEWKSTGRAARFAAAVAIALSFAMQVPGVAVNFYEYIVIVNHQAPHNPYYMPGRQNLMDDQLYPHFVPDFSPVRGHLWLLKHTIINRDLPQNELNKKMQQDYPWRQLMPYAPPPNPARGTGFDFWWVYFVKFFPASRGWVTLLLSTFCAISVLSLAALFLFGRREVSERNTF